ncbi:hypothetical protein FOA52_010713 [Chlamydomonas sp. UWO 241]|nr:hypothetical protein FOA52_010713 [Chlamydomonas sp. UWO 241]
MAATTAMDVEIITPSVHIVLAKMAAGVSRSWKQLLDSHAPEDVLFAFCILSGKVESVRELLLLLEKDRVYADCREGEALALAALRGNEDVCRLLLEWPEHAPRASAQDGRAGVLAALCGHEAVLRLLLESQHAPRGAAFISRALEAAASGGHLPVALLLLHKLLLLVTGGVGGDPRPCMHAIGAAATAARSAGHALVASELTFELSKFEVKWLEGIGFSHKVARADEVAAELLAEEDAAKAKAAAKKGKKGRKGKKGKGAATSGAVEAPTGGEGVHGAHGAEASTSAAGPAFAVATQAIAAVPAASSATAALETAAQATAAAAIVAAVVPAASPVTAAHVAAAAAVAAGPSSAAAVAAAPQQQQRPSRDEETLCVVCFEEERCVTLMPCEHRVLCDVCAVNVRAKNDECPMCRAPINHAVP